MTPMFPGWHLPTLRRKPRTDVQKLMEVKEQIHKMTFSRLGQCFSRYIPNSCFNTDNNTAFSRRRVFSIENTFLGFFQQCTSSAHMGPKNLIFKRHFSAYPYSSLAC